LLISEILISTHCANLHFGLRRLLFGSFKINSSAADTASIKDVFTTTSRPIAMRSNLAGHGEHEICQVRVIKVCCGIRPVLAACMIKLAPLSAQVLER